MAERMKGWLNMMHLLAGGEKVMGWVTGRVGRGKEKGGGLEWHISLWR